MTYWLGVDLGTTFTACAVARAGSVQMVTLEHSAVAVPSVLWIGTNEDVLVGSAAIRRGLTDSTRVVREYKRRFGDTTPLLVGGSPYSAEQLSAKMLRWLVDYVTAQEGGPPEGVALTHPANWGPYKLELLQQLIRMADIGPAVTLTEPQAAALNFAAQARVEVGSTVAVYDLGGGTFDVALLNKTADGFERRGEPEGIERLGGIDFDSAIFGFFVDNAAGALDQIPNDADWAAAIAHLREECSRAKEALSVDTDAVIEGWLPTGRKQVRITRQEFEGLIRPPINETLKAVRRALQSAHLTPADIDSVLLVGGSSRIPLINQMVTAELATRTAVDAHPKNAVALGAARFAAAAMYAPPPAQTRLSELAQPVDIQVVEQRDDDRSTRRQRLLDVVERVEALAVEHQRFDLAERMRLRTVRLRGQRIRVLVAGDFKQGKSSLVNALLSDEICPVDPDFATAVPTVIRYGETLTAQIFRQQDDGELVIEDVPGDQIRFYVNEQDGADPEAFNIRSCEITMPVEWLRDGIEIVDLPGSGGLDSPAGLRAVAEFRQADAVLFVSDASQELTRPELDFLTTATKHCRTVTTVLTKIDSYIDWRVIRDVDAGHLQHADLDLAIVPVSAVLLARSRRTNDDRFAAESGMNDLMRLLRHRVVDEVQARQTIDATVDAETALGQLRAVMLAELEACDPLRQAAVVAELQRSLNGLEDLRLDNASWHRFLRDSIQDLHESSRDELELQMRSLTSEAYSLIASTDPSAIWEEFNSWLRARATTTVADIFTSLMDSAGDLERRLIQQLAQAESAVFKTSNSAIGSAWLGALSLDDFAPDLDDPGRSVTAIEGLWTAAEPLLGLGGMIPGLGPFSLAVGAVAALVFGRKALRQRKVRMIEARRDQAREMVKEYLDEANRLVTKAVERYINQLYRTLRDGVFSRVDELSRSLSDAVNQATAAGSRTEAERVERTKRLTAEVATADALDTELTTMRSELARVGDGSRG
jgi:actin-like ATPase involved in cell morphogenesis